MRTTRRLRLSSETLSDLTTDDLALVAGADAPETLQAGVCPTIPILSCYVRTVWECRTDICTDACAL